MRWDALAPASIVDNQKGHLMMFGHGYGMGWMWVWGLLAGAGLLLFIFVIVRVAAGGIKGASASRIYSGAAAEGKNLTPHQILDERYAKGELATKEYRERLSVLTESTAEEPR